MVSDSNGSRNALPIRDSISMNELSGREIVHKKSQSNPACGGFGCVPVVIGSIVGVGVK